MPTHIGSQIKAAREARGLSQSQLAQRAGTSQQVVAKIETGGTVWSRHLPAIAAVLELQIQPDEGSRIGRAGLASAQDGVGLQAAAEADRILVYTTQLTQDGMAATTEGHIGEMDTPEPLRLGGGFGLYIADDEMAPAYEPGDTALVHSTLPPVPNADCVLMGRVVGHFKQLVKVRRLLRTTPTEWVVVKWSSHLEELYSKAEWPKAYRIVGKYARR